MATTRLSKTIRRIGYAPITAHNDATGVDTYGTPVWFAHNDGGGREYSAEPNGELTEIFADGFSVWCDEENNGYNLSLTLLNVCDDVDEAWLGNVVDGTSKAEYVRKGERPKFALFIIEDTTDGLGKTTIFYNCFVPERPTKAGKTSEGGAIDPEFPEFTVYARPRENDGLVCYELKQNAEFTTVPQPASTYATALTIGNLVLSPMFSAGTTSYTAETTNTSDVINVTPQDRGASVAITVNTSSVENGAAATWTSGSNTVVATVTNGGESKAYTITVTKS